MAVPTPASAVVNGDVVSSAPSWAVAVYSNIGPIEDLNCTGSVIAPDWVLTAAHCVVHEHELAAYTAAKDWTPYQPKSPTSTSEVAPWTPVAASARRVVIGAADASAGSQVGLDSIVANGAYEQTFYFETRNGKPVGYKCGFADRNKSCRHVVSVSLEGDAALLKLNTATAADPIRLAEFDPGVAQAYGYGKSGKAIDGKLRVTKPGAYSLAACSDSSSYLCASTSTSYVDSGDSGGPWVQTRSGEQVQVGISSFGNAKTHYPANVASILPWVGRTAGLRFGTNNKVLLTGAYSQQSGAFGYLESLLEAAGYVVDMAEGSTLPEDLSPYGQIWLGDIQPSSDADRERLIAFAKSGGGLYLTGERPCCESVNAFDASIINSLVVTVGGIQVGGLGDPYYATGPLPVNGAAVENVTRTPFDLSTWQVSAPGGMGNVNGDNIFASADVGGTQVPVGGVWGSDDVVGGGRVAILMDVNWLETGYRDESSASKVALNLAFFLSGLSTPPSAQETPVARVGRVAEQPAGGSGAGTAAS